MSEDALICPLCSRALSAAAPVCPNDHGIEVRGVSPAELERTPRSKRHLLGLTISETYVINGYLGSGGFGAVYKARQTSVGRDVALKLLTTDAVNDPAVIERFRREARTAAALLDPNVVTIFDFGETRLSDEVEDHALWIAMELVVGQTLKSLLREQGSLGLEGSVITGQNILRGLAAAHRLGVVHRDLKPGNVLMDESKRRAHFARLFDFGIASLQGSGGHTMSVGDGGVLGTPKYMAPEQWRAARTTPATDVYAFGIMMAEMLLGQPPIPKMELVQMAAAHCRGPRPRVEWTGTGEAVPLSLSEFIETCTAIDSDLRFPSATEALETLDVIAREFESHRPRTRPAAPPSGAWRALSDSSSSGRIAARLPADSMEDSDSGAFGAYGSSSGSFDEPPLPSADNSGVIDLFDPRRSLDVFDPAINPPTPAPEGIAPPARSGEIPPPLLADDDTIVVDEPALIDPGPGDPLGPIDPIDISDDGPLALDRPSAPRKGVALLPPPAAPRPGPTIPPPFGSVNASSMGSQRRLPVRTASGASIGARASIGGRLGSVEVSGSTSLPPMVTFDSVPPGVVEPEADASQPEADTPAERAPDGLTLPHPSLPGPPTDEDVVPIPGRRPSTAPPAVAPPGPTPEADPPPPTSRRPLWPWTAAAAALLLAGLAFRFVVVDQPIAPDAGVMTTAVERDATPPPLIDAAVPDAAVPDAARDAAVPDAAPDAAPPDAAPVVARVRPATPRTAPVKPKPPVEPKPQPKPQPKPPEPKPPKPQPEPPVAKPEPRPPAPPPPAGADPGEADYLRGVDAMRRGAYNSAQRFLTKALADGLTGERAADARARIGKIAEKASLEDF